MLSHGMVQLHSDGSSYRPPHCGVPEAPQLLGLNRALSEGLRTPASLQELLDWVGRISRFLHRAHSLAWRLSSLSDGSSRFYCAVLCLRVQRQAEGKHSALATWAFTPEVPLQLADQILGHGQTVARGRLTRRRDITEEAGSRFESALSIARAISSSR